MYIGFAWLTVALAVWNFLLFLVRRVWKLWRKRQTATEKKIQPRWLKILLTVLQKSHPLTGLLMVVTGILHGYLALGQSLMMHTGLLLWIGIIALLSIRLMGLVWKSFRKWRIIHIGLDFLFWGLLILHLTQPWLIY